MIRVCIWILERSLLPDLASPVIGDLIEQQDRGSLWMLGETLSALWQLHRHPRLGGGLLHSFFSDLRVAARLLRRSPAFTIVSVLTLGLAIGATTAIFSVVEPVLLRPLPYPDAGQLVLVWERDPDGARDNVGFATFRDLLTQSRTLERAAALGDWQPTLSDKDDPERVQGDRVSWTYFRTLGIRPAVGRALPAVAALRRGAERPGDPRRRLRAPGRSHLGRVSRPSRQGGARRPERGAPRRLALNDF